MSTVIQLQIFTPYFLFERSHLSFQSEPSAIRQVDVDSYKAMHLKSLVFRIIAIMRMSREVIVLSIY